MQLSVIIVSYNVQYFLEQCLYAVIKAAAGLEAEILVVDNASADNSMAYLQRRFPVVTFIQNRQNAGFAKANNQALQAAAGEYILFLNPDTIVAEDSLLKCMRFMQAHPAAGACGVHMIDGSGRYLPESKRGFPSLQTSFYKLSGITALLPRSKKYANYYLGHLSERHNHDADVLAGAFFFARKNVLDITGGFDERFFMYGEDIDLSYRIQQAGYRNYYLAETSIIHFKGESSKKDSLQHIKHFYGAMSIFVQKHYAGRKAALFSMFIQMFIRLRSALTIGRGMMKTKPVEKTGVLHTLIIGDTQSADEAMQILNRYPAIRRHIMVLPADTDLQTLISRQQVQQIIFCEGALSFAAIIAWMQVLPSTLSYRIHAAGSSSIVGSDRKNAAGSILSSGA